MPKLFKGTQKYIDLGKVKHYLSHEEIEKKKYIEVSRKLSPAEESIKQ